MGAINYPLFFIIIIIIIIKVAFLYLALFLQLTVRTGFCLCREVECRAPIEIGTRRINRELANERWNRCAEGCRNYLYREYERLLLNLFVLLAVH